MQKNSSGSSSVSGCTARSNVQASSSLASGGSGGLLGSTAQRAAAAAGVNAVISLPQAPMVTHLEGTGGAA